MGASSTPTQDLMKSYLRRATAAQPRVAHPPSPGEEQWRLGLPHK